MSLGVPQPARDKLRSGRLALRGAPDGDPIEEAFHARTLAPEKRQEFAGVEISGFVAKECFQAPLYVGRFPGAQAVAAGNEPVVAQGV